LFGLVDEREDQRGSECEVADRNSRIGDGGVSSTIYKICDAAPWRDAEAAGAFRGAGIDIRDGYIHFSTAGQVKETAARHFAGVADLLLVAVDANSLGAALRWEPARDGALFPHLYGELPLAGVLWVKPLPLAADGRHVFPELVL
jgi:uncharacterized protein (DUF952 family)